MYELNLVEKEPPKVFLELLKLDPNITKRELDPITASTIASYLYSWQEIILRKKAIERPSDS